MGGHILENFEQPDAGIVAAEFVGTSITSISRLCPCRRSPRPLPDNPHIRYFEGLHRGYMRFEVTPGCGAPTPRASRFNPDADLVNTLASFVVQAGRPGAMTA